jgi:hypothetical protein
LRFQWLPSSKQNLFVQDQWHIYILNQILGLGKRKSDTHLLRFPELSPTAVKLVGRGKYVLEIPGEEAPGHFDLAIRDYTQSTARNQRYPDLVTHRLVKAALAHESSPCDDPSWDVADADTLHDLLEREVIPELYARDKNDIPTAWVARIEGSGSISA